MRVNYDVIIKSGDDEVDMEYGIATLGGTAEVTCLLAEAILRKVIIKRRTHVNPARAVLKKNFTGSYGQNFDLVINEPELIYELHRISKPVFNEVMSFFISQSLYLETRELSNEAEEVVKGLSDIEDELIGRIRAPLKRMHEINVKKNYNIELNFKQRAHDKKKVIELDTATATNLFKSKVAKKTEEIRAYITRFNARTGNGRLVLEGEDETVAFGFYSPLRIIMSSQKKMISENLHVNNSPSSEGRIYLKLTVSRVRINSGETIKYLVHTVQ
ncbi:hypothetical protein [Pectobacterium wasabiae]|uniref:Uncharacterized protein n=1 Tax=Pectobacterium wasabiae TaxID=55208 RepID=A0AAW3EQ32_9GAMM|nr:hypothetical protein [Pectobacterium wasabiae]AOR65118.1 hypothetical protein A7983_18010 [Pectobacterium wasabiae CFBP 3304]EJS96550.1 Hypothetical protein Y17_0428 [Pectobacterium wasabiae CFBP 3304]KFX09620.1 hypothetical protein JV38_01450 [Pectobacterium wasabiae]KGA29822.1 hypothetical protein KU73_05175 [Pectobacterium wasabiae]